MEPKIRERRTKTPEQALQSLMRLCARAEKSSGDARRLMRGWGVTPDAAEKVLQQLVAQRFIDDERYAAAFVREKCSLSGWGAYKIRTALQRKEIAPRLIDEALSAIDREASCERLLTQLRRKMARTKAATPYELRGKLLRYGLSLGFDYAMVGDAVAQLIQNDDFSCDF